MPKKTKKFKSKSITSFVVPEKKEGEDKEKDSNAKLESQLHTEKKKEFEVETDENILEDINEKNLKTDKKSFNEKIEKDKTIEKSNKINLDKYLDKLQKISLKDKIFFTKNLSVMLKAGLSLGKAMEALSEQTVNKKFQKTLKKINEKIKKLRSENNNVFIVNQQRPQHGTQIEYCKRQTKYRRQLGDPIRRGVP